MNFLEIGGVVFKEHTFLFREEILLTRKAIVAGVLIQAETSWFIQIFFKKIILSKQSIYFSWFK